MTLTHFYVTEESKVMMKKLYILNVSRLNFVLLVSGNTDLRVCCSQCQVTDRRWKIPRAKLSIK